MEDSVSFNRGQFRSLIGDVLLKEKFNASPPFYSFSAVELLMGTAAVESQLGTYLRQVGGGPALGVMQMEPATFRWLRDRYDDEFPRLKGREAAELEWDLGLSILSARLRYWADPAPLPAWNDLSGLARTWKRVYNSALGAGIESAFLDRYRRLCL